MAQKVLIMGESGTGKSTSLRNCDPATTAVINPVGKPRIHRIGQNRPCYYYYLLVKGSFEERNLAALQEGKELTDELFT